MIIARVAVGHVLGIGQLGKHIGSEDRISHVHDRLAVRAAKRTSTRSGVRASAVRGVSRPGAGHGDTLECFERRAAFVL